jgi:hypothetical protein
MTTDVAPGSLSLHPVWVWTLNMQNFEIFWLIIVYFLKLVSFSRHLTKNLILATSREIEKELKGTLARDFRHLFFIIKGKLLGS